MLLDYEVLLSTKSGFTLASLPRLLLPLYTTIQVCSHLLHSTYITLHFFAGTALRIRTSLPRNILISFWTLKKEISWETHVVEGSEPD